MSEKNFRFIVLTGAPGVGKTSLIKKVCNALQGKCVGINGFFTEEIKSNNKRIGFDVVTLNGNRAPLARIAGDQDSAQDLVGKYSVKLDSFESCVLPVFKSWDKTCILVIDEIGKMELRSRQFKDIVQKYIEGPEGLILATVPLATAKPIPIVETIKNHSKTILMTVDKDTRNHLENKIVSLIIEATKNR